MTAPVLLVHGAFTGAWIWEDVLTELGRHGVTATTVDLPSRTAEGTLDSDARAVRDALAALDGPAVLVGHSYGGAVITRAAADNPDVVRLVYVCAVLPQADEAVGDVLARDPAPAADLSAILVPAEDGTATLSREGARTTLYNDATDEQAASALDRMGRHALGTLAEKATGLGWREHPSTYVLTLQDKQFSVALQREFASHASRTVELDAGHGPMLTRPAELAAIIAEDAVQE